MASISSSWTRGMGVDSQSSMVWKVRSASGMYHLQSYCCPFLLEDNVFIITLFFKLSPLCCPALSPEQFVGHNGTVLLRLTSLMSIWEWLSVSNRNLNQWIFRVTRLDPNSPSGRPPRLTPQPVSSAWCRAAGRWKGRRDEVSWNLRPAPPWSDPSAVDGSANGKREIASLNSQRKKQITATYSYSTVSNLNSTLTLSYK